VSRPIIGTPHETETLLHASDMYVDGTPWNHAIVAAGPKRIAPYAIRIAADAPYRIEVRRWPREANGPMAGIPTIGKKVDAWLYDKPVKGLIYGEKMKALPVTSVQLKVGVFKETKPVSASDTSIVFTARLKKGDFNLQADLLDQQGEILTSAYYVYVRKI
jgi:hypothetical protein